MYLTASHVCHMYLNNIQGSWCWHVSIPLDAHNWEVSSDRVEHPTTRLICRKKRHANIKLRYSMIKGRSYSFSLLCRNLVHMFTSMFMCNLPGPLVVLFEFPKQAKTCSIPNLMWEQKPFKKIPDGLTWASSKNDNLIAKIRGKLNFSSKAKWRENHAKIL